jgi:hypothetical protein
LINFSIFLILLIFFNSAFDIISLLSISIKLSTSMWFYGIKGVLFSTTFSIFVFSNFLVNTFFSYIYFYNSSLTYSSFILSSIAILIIFSSSSSSF